MVPTHTPATNLTKAHTVQDVITGISVSNVGGNTQHLDALIVKTNSAVVQPVISRTIGLGPKPPEYPNLPTQVKWLPLSEYLDGYDLDAKQFILDGFKFGFSLNFSGVRCSQDSHNLTTAKDNPEIVCQKLLNELTTGRIAGPFDSVPFPDFKCSPLGLVPKRKEGQFRLIHHLSYPRHSGTSVNAGIDKEYTSVSYAGIPDAVAVIKRIGKGCFMAKTDLMSAYRILPVSPKDYPLLGFSWEGKLYYDKCLAMGCSSSCLTFEKFSSALEWIAVQKLGCRGVVHILDDFLFVESTFKECEDSLNKFIAFCNSVGIPIAMDKTYSPNQIMDFVSITLDSMRMEARLPPDKIQKCVNLLGEFIQRNSCKKREMESLIGYLNFTCSVVLPGRAFLRRLISLIMGVKEPFHYLKISQEAKSDLRTWSLFISKFNGKSMFLNDRLLSSETLSLYTDAAASLGFGTTYSSYWFYGPFPCQCRHLNITLLELYPIVVAVNVWGHLWRNHCIRFYTDNQALMYILNRQTSKDKYIMQLVRKLVLACLKFNILFQSSHVEGCKNVLADSLSRLQVDTFRRLSPDSKPLPTLIPSELSPGMLLPV